jgi:general secretion pathway protein L
MARAIGIDISTTHLRAVTIVSSYRHNVIERTAEVDLREMPDLREAVAAVVMPMLGHGESIALGISGVGSYLLRIELPGTALRQIEQIVPFELEARVPVDVEELVHDFTVNREKGESEAISVLIAAAPIAKVRSFIDDCRGALGKEAERVGCGPLPLSNLIPYLPRDFLDDKAIAILDLGEKSSDLIIIVQGRPAFARTISQGVDDLPGSAEVLAASIHQTICSWVAQTDRALATLYLTGIGANVVGAESYLSQHLEIGVLPLPKPSLTLSGEATWESMMPYSKAIGIALGLGIRPLDPDLRSGPLGYQRGYAFLKEKAPLLAGLVTAMFISFLFASWAGLRSLNKEQVALKDELESVSQQVLGKALTDPSEAHELLAKQKSLEESDPMPHMDAFDVVVAVSSAIPETIMHDIEEFDMQREHVKMTGIVGTADEAQQVASKLKEQRCFQEVKLSKVVQVVNSDRQKYGLEWDVRCPEDDQSKAKKKKPEEKKPEEPAGGAR